MSHGGIEAAQELCRYANERGVRIMPGVAINAYGGIVWEMDHDYNLATWLRKHPELAAADGTAGRFQDSTISHSRSFSPTAITAFAGAPRKRGEPGWMEEGIAWLAETFEVGGINIEAGDYGVCGCAIAKRAGLTARMPTRRQGYAESLVARGHGGSLSPALRCRRARNGPTPGFIREIQWDNLLDR